LGNFFTVRDLLEQGWPGEVIRFVMLSTHYRSPMDWTVEKAQDAKETLTKWRRTLAGVIPSTPSKPIFDALADDLNVHEALVDCHRQFSALNAWQNGAVIPDFDASAASATLLASLQTLGLLVPELDNWVWQEASTDPFQPELKQLLELRFNAKTQRDYAKADVIRNFLNSLGFELKDHSEGTSAEIDVFSLLHRMPPTSPGVVRVSLFAPGSRDLGEVSAILRAKMREKLEALK
jgi:cysteinyl-tRNA synthetase